MLVRVTLRVTLPDGTPVVGARISAHNVTAWFPSSKQWYGTTLMDGTFTWDNLDVGFGDKYEFEVKYVDQRGVIWQGEISDKIRGPTKKDVVLREAYVEELGSVEISPEVEAFLMKETGGSEILDAMREFSLAVGNGLSRSAVSLSTIILEGMIQVKARREDAWNEEFSDMTFGKLIHQAGIKRLFPIGIFDKLDGLNKFRINASHYKAVKTIEAEAQIAVQVIRETSTYWFALKTETGNNERQPSGATTVKSDKSQ